MSPIRRLHDEIGNVAMSKTPKTTIEVDEPKHAEVFLFTVRQMENGCCKQSLPFCHR